MIPPALPPDVRDQIRELLPRIDSDYEILVTHLAARPPRVHRAPRTRFLLELTRIHPIDGWAPGDRAALYQLLDAPTGKLGMPSTWLVLFDSQSVVHVVAIVRGCERLRAIEAQASHQQPSIN